MFVFRIIHFPGIGQYGELRAHLEENVKQAQANGARTNLIQKVVYEGGPVFVVNRIYENLEAAEKDRDQVLTDPAARERLQKSASLRRKEIDIELFNVLVPPKVQPQGRYILRFKAYPALGNWGMVGSIMTEFTKADQAERPYMRLSMQLHGSDGGVIAVQTNFETLAQYENEFINNPPASAVAVTSQVVALSRTPPVTEFYEVLIPKQS